MNVNPSTDITVFKKRRAQLAARIRANGGGVAIIPTSSETIRNNDSHYRFRFDSYFYYLTGFREPDAALVIDCSDSQQDILFCRKKDPDMELWEGYRCGPEAAPEQYAMEQSFAIDEFAEHLPRLINQHQQIYYAIAYNNKFDDILATALQQARRLGRTGQTAPGKLLDVYQLIDEQRLIKDVSEIAIMRRAAEISAAAHQRAMQVSKAGLFEYHLEAELLHGFTAGGCESTAYNSIVASGANACVLHYTENRSQLQDGELVLIDAGGELSGYAADITRCFPVNGRFSAAQKQVYEVVLAAQLAAIDAVKPGNNFNAPHDIVVDILTEGLLELGLLKGNKEDNIKEAHYRRFFMHRTGHWLGLDVHDVGTYKADNAWRELVPGMVLTVEPGLYIRPAEDIDPAFWNIGVRIEDDVLVTANGPDVLSRDIVKSVTDIEQLMSH